MSAPAQGAPPARATGGRRLPVLVVAGYYPPHVGGVEVCAERYGRGLAGRGHDVQVVTSAVGAEPGAQDVPLAPAAGGGRGAGRLRVLRLRGPEAAHTPLLPGLLPAVWRLARGRVVHLHTGHITTDVAAGLAARARRAPLVVHYHMDLPAAGRVGELVLPRYKRWVLGPLLRSAARVVVLTDGQRDDAVRRYRLDPARVVTVPNGVDEEFARVERTAGAAGEPLRVLAVCRLVPQKAPAVLVRAVARATAPVRCSLVGGGELAAPLRELAAELALGERLRMPGVLRGPDLLGAYADADVFVVTSAAEGMPLALLEAMAAGLAVVARDVPELRAVVGGAGVLVPVPEGPGDPDDLDRQLAAGIAAALDALAADPARRAALGEAARRAVAGAGWDERVAALEQVLLAAAGRTAEVAR